MNTLKTVAILAFAFAVAVPHHPASAAGASGDRTSWCGPTRNVKVSFRLKRSGKTVSICKDGETLVYAFGTLGDEPELEYRGPVLGSARFPGIIWSPRDGDDGDHGLARLAGMLKADPDHPQAGAAGRLASAARARESNGFYVFGLATGIVSQLVYVFRTGGWEYAVVTTSGRPIALGDEAKEYESREITLVSPDGKLHRLEGAAEAP